MIRENNIKNRAISVFLVISMLVTNFLNIAMAYAETSEYEKNIGCTATFNTDVYDYFPVSDDPSNLSWDPEYQLIEEDLEEGFKVVITDYYVSNNEGDLPCLWYKVKAAPDCEAPEKLIQYSWVFQNYLGEYADPNDSLIIEKIEEDNITVFDEHGNKVGKKIEMPQFEKIKLIGKSSLSGEVDYQWQILIDDTWIDIYGEDEAEFLLSYGVVATVLDNFQAQIRLTTKKSSKVFEGESITVTVIPYEEDEFEQEEIKKDETPNEPEVHSDDEEFTESTVENDSSNFENNSNKNDKKELNEEIPTSDGEDKNEKKANESDTAITPSADAADDSKSESNSDKTEIEETVEKTETNPKAEESTVSPEITPSKEEDETFLGTLLSMFTMTVYAENGDEVEGIKHTLTVRFVSGDSNNGIFQTYTAEFKQGEVRTINIPVPFKEGYHAEYDDGTGVVKVVDNAIPMEGKSLTADEELVVRYYPNLTPYKAVHYIQNIDNDEYTIYKEETNLTGLTDSKVPDDLHLTEEELPGFYKIPYTRPSIAADGSTVIEIYYDRYYYLMNFDLGQGGYGVEPVYARYETEIEFGTPIRKGYTFKGWTLNDNVVTSPQTIPAYDCTIVAAWEASTAEYTIVYWKENAQPNADGTYGYSYWTSRVVDATAGTTVSGRDDVAVYVTDETYFTYNDARTDKNVLVKGDGSSVVNVYYLRNYYDIYFYVSSNGQNTINSCQVPTHSHDDGTCTKYLICGLKEDHVHGATCEEYLVCGVTAHTHSSECCTKTEHSEHTFDCCTLSTDHTHTRACYAGNGITVDNSNSDDDDRLEGAPNDAAEGYIYRYNNNRSYVYTNGHWYRIRNGSYRTGDIATTYCSGAHTHGDGNCTCAVTIHTHGDGNCSCSKTAHTHSDNCYKYSCGKIQHTHTNNCYSTCTKAEHTHNDGNCTNGNGKYLLKIIHAKYEADISAEWPVADNNINGLKGFAYWTGNGNTKQSSRVVTMNSDWAKSSGVKVNANYNSTEYQLNYWFEDFDQTDNTTNSTRVYRNGKYYVLSDKYTQVAYYVSTNSWGYKEITGMVATAESASISNRTANLYYNRSTHTLTFESYNEEVKKETGVMFEKPLNYYLDEDGNCTVIPEYPTGTLEEGGYYFAGWYYTKECFEGTEYDFSRGTMPNGDLTLYAKWAPVEHTIEFYFDSSLTQKLSATDGFATQKVLHNNYGADPGLPGHPLDFDAVVWFYKDEDGDEHPFDFSMQIKHDMKLYPHWRSNVFIDYEIHYLIEGTNEAIAEPTVGEELYGKSVTFEPKGQDDFYEQYREGGYFVFTPTHTIVMGESKCPTNSTNCYWDENAKKHVFTFYYSEGPTVPYTVRYLDKVTDDVIFPDKTVSDNRKAIVVENALIKAGYRPDEAQKSLVVVKDGTSNVITFYYEKDETATYYTITHYIKKYGTDEYVVYQETPYNAAVGDIVPNQSPLNLDGFTYVETENTILGGEVGEIGTNGEPGLEIKMYYDEKPVTIYYEVIGNFGGTVSPESNTMGIVYGTASGSTATPESNAYRFVGWYADFEGKQLISTNPKFVPTKKANEKWVNGTIYYAKFEPDKSSLTIQKKGAEPIDENQSFIFKVTGIDDNTKDISITVVIHGNDSVTIKDMPIGKYRVEEITDWSWRYTPDPASKGVSVGAEGATVPFNNNRDNKIWLDGNAYCDNWFGKSKTSTEEEVAADE